MRQVYFVRRADGIGPIKIGCTVAVKARIRQLESDCQTKFAVLATAPGGYTVERNLHIKFAAINVPGPVRTDRATPLGGSSEWFAPTPELFAFIHGVTRSGEIALSENDCRERIFASRYEGGETLQQIADDYGITRERVRQILRKAGVESQGMRWGVGKRKSVALLNSESVARLARNGATVMDIVREIGSDPISIRRLLEHLGIVETPSKKGRGFHPETFAKASAIAADYVAGVSTTKIAQKHGVPQPHIYRLIRLVGVTPGRRPHSRAIPEPTTTGQAA
jgi:transposase-like protein